MAIVVACFGNVLRRDDGFGVAVAQRLEAGGIPEGVRVLDIGIGGIHLVQQLGDDVDALVVVDAVDTGRRAGSLVVMQPEVVDVSALDAASRRDALADMHYATPERALMLARALGVLPDRTLLIGCQPADAHALGQGLSARVEHAVDAAVAEVRRVVGELGVSWPGG